MILDLFSLDKIGEQLVQAISPGLVIMLPATAAATRQIVRVARKRVPAIDGNCAQTVAVIVSLAVVAITASGNAVFADGTDARELAGLLLIAAVNAASATGVNEWLKDRPSDNTLKREAEDARRDVFLTGFDD